MGYGSPNLRGLGVAPEAVDFALSGDPAMVVDPRTGYEERARYIVADEFTAMASEASIARRPDRCGLINSIATRVRSGTHVTKKQSAKAAREIAECKRRLADREPRAHIIYPVMSRAR